MFAVQAVFALEEGAKKMHAHIQAAAVLVLRPYENVEKDLASLLRLMCGFKTGDLHKWALKVKVNPFDINEQKTLRKINRAGLFGYCLKQRFTSAIFKCVIQDACALSQLRNVT